MTPRERFLAAFEHRETDRVPVFDAVNNPELYIRSFGRDNYHLDGALAARLYREMGLDACFIPVGGYTGLIGKHQRWISADTFEDEFGTGFFVSPTSWPLALPVKPTLVDRRACGSLSFPDASAPWRFEEVRKAAEESKAGGERIAVVAGIRSSFSALFISMGIEAMSAALFDDPELLEEMSVRLCEFWTDVGLGAVEAGADALYIANDMGLNTGTLISPDDLRKYFIPPFAEQVRRLKASGAKVILHSCGNINAVLDDLVRTGIDGLNNLQVAAGMDIDGVKKAYGDRITLIGNVDATNVMTSEDPKVIEDAVRDLVNRIAPGGGFVLATDHSFHMGIPPKNVDVFLEAARRWGGRRGA